MFRKPLFRHCSLSCLNLHWGFYGSFLNLTLAFYLCLLIFATSDNLPVWTKMPGTNIDRVWDACHSLGTLLLKAGEGFIMLFVKLENSERKTFSQHCSWMEIVFALGGYASMYLFTLSTLMKKILWYSVTSLQAKTKHHHVPKWQYIKIIIVFNIVKLIINQ